MCCAATCCCCQDTWSKSRGAACKDPNVLGPSPGIVSEQWQAQHQINPRLKGNYCLGRRCPTNSVHICQCPVPVFNTSLRSLQQYKPDLLTASQVMSRTASL